VAVCFEAVQLFGAEGGGCPGRGDHDACPLSSAVASRIVRCGPS
jgi:hypothetical protein